MKAFKGVVAVLYLVALIPFLAWWQGVINNVRTREHHYEMEFEVTPIEFLGSGMIGGFRGLMINYLWIKVIGLEQQHKYFEVSALVELIQKLQPNIASTWSFNSWNMAYNISTDYRSAESKWRWILQGIHVIEEGIGRIPDSAELWHKAGWLYYDKISNPSNEHALYFQKMTEEKQLQKRKEALEAGRKFDQPIYALALAYQDFKRAAQLKQHPTVSERTLECLPFYASVRGVRYFLLMKRPAEVAEGLKFLDIAIKEFRELAGKYSSDEFEGVYNQARDLMNYIEEGVQRYPDHVAEFEQATDQIDQIFRDARIREDKIRVKQFAP
jgi:hypothetical protein